MNLRRFKLLTCITISAVAISACNKDDDNVNNPPNGNEEELITTIKLIFTPTDNPAVSSEFVYSDVDGLGGNDPVIDTIVLAPAKSYNVEVILLDESKTPADSISNEVREEANDHLFAFSPNTGDVTVLITDYDTNTPALPLGLSSTWSTTIAGTFQVGIVLKHQPGIKNGDINLGESDIEITMPLVVR